MLNYHADRTDLRSIQANQRALVLSFDDQYFRRWFPAASLFANTVTPPGRAHNERFEYWVFADALASTQRVVGNLATPNYWLYGKVEFTLYWGGPAASTNPVRWAILANSLMVGENYTTPTELSAAQNMPGPAVANTWKTSTFTSALQINVEDRLIGFRITREGTNAGDTYAADAHLLGVFLHFMPAIRESHVL